MSRQIDKIKIFNPLSQNENTPQDINTPPMCTQDTLYRSSRLDPQSAPCIPCPSNSKLVTNGKENTGPFIIEREPEKDLLM
ncbi:hypothetical protein BB560_002613 [Smittium megazygosporum]|uniref:Uncharacterized protein n=1 Tax=Smittium megazygosporum TaxID=133381 RepID=A0A2T9ZE74_9FUNG|nr:hypothetical protein BB560_002613 [Smittium megazygosporum]